MSRQRRVCIVAPEFVGPFRNGGVGTACYWQALALARAGDEVTVLYTGPTAAGDASAWAQRFRREAGIRYVDLTAWLAQCGDVPGLKPSTIWPRIAEQALAFLRADPAFDVIYVQEFLGQGLRILQAARSGSLPGKPVTIATLHSPTEWIYEGMDKTPRDPADLHCHFMEQESARLCDELIAPSVHMAEWVKRRWRLQRPIRVLPNCFDPRFARTSEAPVTFSGFRELVFFGRLETRKGLHLLLRAIRESRSLSRRLNQVLFLGKPGLVDGRPALEVIAETLDPIGLRWQALTDKDAHAAWEWLQARSEALVVAPSVQDNLPYAVVELYCRRLPFLSTAIGGIPEITGPANAHLLVAPDARDLRDRLEHVLEEDLLTVHYSAGYDTARAQKQFLRFHQSLRPQQNKPDSVGRRICILPLNGEEAPDSPHARRADWLLFVDPGLSLQNDTPARLREAAIASGLEAATGFAALESGQLLAPIGPALEPGFHENCLCGGCLIISRKAWDALRPVGHEDYSSLWGLAFALAAQGLRWVVLPQTIGTAHPDYEKAEQCLTRNEVHRLRLIELISESAQRPDLAPPSFLLQSLVARAHTSLGSATLSDGELYRELASVDEETIEAFLFKRGGGEAQSTSRAFGQACRRAATVATQIQGRLYLYGAGEHSKALLAAVPALLPHLKAFIDRRGSGTLMGVPIIPPESYVSEPGDNILYSSMGSELSMWEAMRSHRVRHILLYHESLTAPERKMSHAAA